MRKEIIDIRTVKVSLWGTTIGYLHKQENGLIGFQFDDKFVGSGIEVSPLKMPLSRATYVFPGLSEETFCGLPGMLADSLPDKFGNIVIKRYLESQGRADGSLTALEKLCYVGKRGMGALQYEPAVQMFDEKQHVDIDALTKLASDILEEREGKHLQYDERMISQLMQGSSSVGGARAKTLIAWNEETNDVRSGQIDAGSGYEYWLLKFDNISNNRDKDEVPDHPEYTKIEYAYYLMATAAGIQMSECRLFKENGRAHFMTRRFDRKGDNGEKLHMQSLCAMAHMDFNKPRGYSYEDAFGVMRQLKLPYEDFLQLYKRMVFNEFAKNYDDHTKNITFLMNKKGEWRLAPAYDITFAYNPNSIWVSAHQLLINGKSIEVTIEDFMEVAKKVGIKKRDAENCIKEIKNTIQKWDDYAKQAEMSLENLERIKMFLE